MNKFLYRIILGGLLSGWFTIAQAQESNLSQYNHTPFLTNPGMIGNLDQAGVILNHRNQSVDAGKTYATSTISGYYPIALGNHRLGVGASFLSDRAADFMSTNGGLLGTAYRVQLSQRHTLSLGAQVGFFNRKLNSSFSYTTDSQFLNGSYNADAPTGEIFIQQSRNFTTLTTGLFWQMKDGQERQMAFAGVSLFNVNQPNVGFAEESRMPASLKGTAGLRVFQGERLSVMPNVRWLYRADAHLLNSGTWLRYDLSESVEYPQHISLGVWYNSNKAGVFALEYAKSRYLVGLSYDIPMMSELGTLQQGGIFEVALSLRIGNKAKPVVTQKASTPVVAQTLSAPTTPAEPKRAVAPAAEPSEPTQKEKPASVSSLKGNGLNNNAPAKELPRRSKPQLAEKDRLVLEKTVRFDLRTTELTGDSREFLDEVADVLKRNEDINILLVGHTCSIGTEANNEQLSLERAAQVKQYLTQQGIDPSHIVVEGQGEKSPIADNGTETGRGQNRRVEFKIIDKGVAK